MQLALLRVRGEGPYFPACRVGRRIPEESQPRPMTITQALNSQVRAAIATITESRDESANSMRARAMSKLTRRWVVIVTMATLFIGPSVARAHGHGGGFHGGYHHGWGHWGYGGWGYAPLGFGLGLGLGYGLGYGAGYGWGYPYYGWGGYPYGYWGPPYRYGYVAPYGYGVGYPYSYGPYGWYGASTPATTNVPPAAYVSNTPAPAATNHAATSTFASNRPAPAAPAPFAPPAPAKSAQRMPTTPEFSKRGDWPSSVEIMPRRRSPGGTRWWTSPAMAHWR